MPIIVIDSQYPHHKNKEVIETWLKALEKHPRPEGLFTPLVETMVKSSKSGLNVFSAYLLISRLNTFKRRSFFRIS